MQFKVIATGSAGNCYILNDDAGNCIIIEAGVDRTKIVANLPKSFRHEGSICIISHKHGDHAHYAESMKSYFPTYKAWEYNEGLLYESKVWKVINFKVEHNCDCRGFSIINKTENKKFLFITDFFAISDRLVDSIYLTEFDFCAIECNFNNFLLKKEADEMRKASSLNHLSDDNFIKLVGKIRRKETGFCSIHGSAHFLSHTMLNAKFQRKFSNYFEIAKIGTTINF